MGANTQFVDRRYPGSDSDGSRQKPWTTVRAGVSAAAAGAIVAVDEGRYEEDVVIAGKPVRLWGRCPARTELAGRGVQPGTITISRGLASGSEVRGFAVTGPAAGVVVRGARSVVLEELWVHDARNVGVVLVSGAGGVTLRGALLERNHPVGMLVEGSEATVVRATRPRIAGNLGWGIGVQQSSTTGEKGKLSLVGSLIEQNHEVGVTVLGSEATIVATAVRGTRPSRTSEGFGDGIAVVEYGEPSRVVADKSPHFVAIFSEKLNMKARRREDFPEILLPVFPPSCEFFGKFEGMHQAWWWPRPSRAATPEPG